MDKQSNTGATLRELRDTFTEAKGLIHGMRAQAAPLADMTPPQAGAAFLRLAAELASADRARDLMTRAAAIGCALSAPRGIRGHIQDQAEALAREAMSRTPAEWQSATITH